MTAIAPNADPACSPPNSCVIRVANVRKTYVMGDQAVHALAGVSLDVARGDFWAILGQSGSGKSTLLNLLGCLDRPTSGQYWLNGQDVSQLDDDRLSDARLRELGFIFQSFNLIQQLTVVENVALPLFYLGWDPALSVSRAEGLVRQLGLGHRLSHRPAELSGGQQQRVAIARALVNDPAVILADEPTGNLDSATGEEVMGILKGLNAQGKTIIMVTHEPDVAANARRQLHMRDGKVDRVV